MRVAILHYHLRPGGVTKVIQNALSSLSSKTIHTVVVAGEPSEASMPIPRAVIVEGLGYYNQSAPVRSPHDVVKTLEQVVVQHLGALPDVWHIHNHGLGKNAIMAEVAYLLSQRGHRLLLQPHDFAEDGRPANYRLLRERLAPNTPEEFGSHLYPQGKHVHYALINPRDLRLLETVGVHPAQLHYVPNAVEIEHDAEDDDLLPEDAALLGDIDRVFFYPARAIRRKNIGEFLLWAALAAEGERYAIARAPKNPMARPIYDSWVQFSHSLKLPVQFGLGEQWRGTFRALLRASSAIMTTSVAEGFGLAFLEPWLVKRPLLGRHLPEITSPLEKAGIDLSALYRRLDVPIEWVGRQNFRLEVDDQLKRVYESYGRILRQEDLECAITEAIQDDRVDVGKLNETFQQRVIRHLADSPAARDEIVPQRLTLTDDWAETVRKNQETVLAQFNLDRYGKQLLHLYQTVAESEVEFFEPIDTHRLLDLFLDPKRFCLLRT